MATVEEVITWISYAVGGVIGLLILWLFKSHYGQIMSFFKPDDWVYVTMLEADNNCSSWYQHKSKDLRFEFNDGFYNMYEVVGKIKKQVPDPVNAGQFKEIEVEDRKERAVYRSGRLAQFFYVEGNEDPLDFRNLKITGNPQMKKMVTKLDFSQLWIGEEKGLLGLLKQYGIIIVIVGIIIIIFVLLSMNGDTRTVATGVQE